MNRTGPSGEYQIRRIADRYEVRTPQGSIRGEYLTLAEAEWAVRHGFAPVPSEPYGERPSSREPRPELPTPDS